MIPYIRCTLISLVVVLLALDIGNKIPDIVGLFLFVIMIIIFGMIHFSYYDNKSYHDNKPPVLTQKPEAPPIIADAGDDVRIPLTEITINEEQQKIFEIMENTKAEREQGKPHY